MNTLPIRSCRALGRGALVTRSRKLQGAYILEVAITLGVFIMLVLAVIEMAFLILAYTTVGHLSQQGLRFAMVRGSQAAQEVTRRQVGEERTDIPANSAKIEAFVHGISTLKPVENVDVVGCWPGTVGDIDKCPVAMYDGVNNRPGDAISVTVTYQYQPMVIPGSGWFGSPTLSSTSVGTVLY